MKERAIDEFIHSSQNSVYRLKKVLETAANEPVKFDEIIRSFVVRVEEWMVEEERSVQEQSDLADRLLALHFDLELSVRLLFQDKISGRPLIAALKREHRTSYEEEIRMYQEVLEKRVREGEENYRDAVEKHARYGKQFDTILSDLSESPRPKVKRRQHTP